LRLPIREPMELVGQKNPRGLSKNRGAKSPVIFVRHKKARMYRAFLCLVQMPLRFVTGERSRQLSQGALADLIRLKRIFNFQRIA
jgi:hypothetical protein